MPDDEGERHDGDAERTLGRRGGGLSRGIRRECRDAARSDLLARWADPAEDEACRAWARSAHEQVERFGAGAAYLNSLPAEGEEPVRATFGAGAYARLVALKDRYDPGNLFRLNHNIRPRG